MQRLLRQLHLLLEGTGPKNRPNQLAESRPEGLVIADTGDILTSPINFKRHCPHNLVIDVLISLAQGQGLTNLESEWITLYSASIYNEILNLNDAWP